jgi:hypothetical protein
MISAPGIGEPLGLATTGIKPLNSLNTRKDNEANQSWGDRTTRRPRRLSGENHKNGENRNTRVNPDPVVGRLSVRALSQFPDTDTAQKTLENVAICASLSLRTTQSNEGIMARALGERRADW